MHCPTTQHRIRTRPINSLEQTITKIPVDTNSENGGSKEHFRDMVVEPQMEKNPQAEGSA